MYFKRAGLELLDLMRAEGARSWSLPELKLQTDWPRTSIIAALVWLEDCGAVVKYRDAEMRKLWTLTSDAPEEWAAPVTVDPQLAEVAASLDASDLAAELLAGANAGA